MRSIRCIPLGIAALAVLAGCGASDDRSQARMVVEQFADALQRDRGSEACARLSHALSAEIESDAGAPCASAVRELELERSEIVAVKVYATNAVVELRDGQTNYLGREPDGWRPSAVGCKREPGRPRGAPLACRAES